MATAIIASITFILGFLLSSAISIMKKDDERVESSYAFIEEIDKLRVENEKLRMEIKRDIEMALDRHDFDY